jgi:hypothetical protein
MYCPIAAYAKQITPPPWRRTGGTVTISHLPERIQYNQDEAAWLAKRAPEGEEPWLEWDFDAYGYWEHCLKEPEFAHSHKYRRRPKMLSCIDAKGVEHKFPEPMREAPEVGGGYWLADVTAGRVSNYKWTGGMYGINWLAAGLCQATEEGTRDQLKAARAIFGGGE